METRLNYIIPRVVQLKKVVLYCRRNARFPVHSSPHRKFQKCAACVLIRSGQFNYDNRSYQHAEAIFGRFDFISPTRAF